MKIRVKTANAAPTFITLKRIILDFPITLGASFVKVDWLVAKTPAIAARM
jgi:hypothetical protein